MKYKLVFWDWLGTLFSSDFLVHSRLYDLKSRGLLDQDFDLNNIKCNEIVKFKQLLKNYEALKIPATWYLVDVFTSLGVSQVIVSNGLRSSIMKHLKDYNPFDMILTAEEFSPKPSLDMLTYAMKDLKILNKSEILFIGDSAVDEATAKAFEIDFYKIENYYTSAYFIMKNLQLI